MAPNSHQPSNELSATYKASSDQQNFGIALPEPTFETRQKQERQAYLTGLKKAIVTMQKEVNVFLTQKMGEENAHAIATTNGRPVDEQKEEDNYGEEADDE